jgi:hypothetical protein
VKKRCLAWVAVLIAMGEVGCTQAYDFDALSSGSQGSEKVKSQPMGNGCKDFPNVTFCDDFDSPTLNPVWVPVVPGAVESRLDPDVFYSGSQSLFSKTPTNSGQLSGAAIRQDIPKSEIQVGTILIDMEVYVGQAEVSPGPESPFFSLKFDKDISESTLQLILAKEPLEENLYSVRIKGTQPDGMPFEAPSPILVVGQMWTRVSLKIDIASTQSKFVLMVDGMAGVVRVNDVLEEVTFFKTNLGSVSATLGLVGFEAWEINIDNFVLDITKQ